MTQKALARYVIFDSITEICNTLLYKNDKRRGCSGYFDGKPHEKELLCEMVYPIFNFDDK